jgi:predicted RND superfamily exporter protein
MIDRLAKLAVRWRYGLLILVLLLTGAAIPYAALVDFDAQIETLFSPGDQLLQDYLASLRTFGGDELVIIAYEDPELLSVQGLQRQERIIEAVHEADQQMRRSGIAVDGAVQSVTALARSPNPVAPLRTETLLEQLRRDWAKLSSAEIERRRQELLSGLRKSELHCNLVIGEDGTTAAILVTLLPDVGKGKQRRKLVVETLTTFVRQAAAQEGLTVHIAGGPVLVAEAVQYLEQDGYMFLYGTTFLLTLVLIVLFRSVRWVLFPLLVVHLALIWTKAVVYLMGITLTMISSILTAMITVIGVATVAHMTMRYRHLREVQAPAEAAAGTLRDLWFPTFYTSATTAVGFASLIICAIAPVRTFGVLMATGTMLLWLLAVLLLPTVALLRGVGPDPREAFGEGSLVRYLERVFRWVREQPGWVVLGGLLLGVALAVGWSRLRVETDFTRNFRRSAPVAVASRFVEERLGGSGVLEVNFATPSAVVESLSPRTGSAPLVTPEFIDRVRRLTEELRQVPGVAKAVALVDVLEFLDQSSQRGGLLGRLHALMPLPAKLALLRRQRPDIVAAFWNPELNRMRVVLRAKEAASAEEKERVIQTVRQIAEKYFPPTTEPLRLAAQPVRSNLSNVTAAFAKHESNPQRAGQGTRGVAEKPTEASSASHFMGSDSDLRDYYVRRGQPVVTGHYVLLHHLVSRLLEDQRNTFAVAGAGCFLLLALAFRSIRLGLVATIPNATPIAMVIGAMGWLNIPINVATAMLAAVSMGMAVDSSIHYVYRFALLRRSGLPFEEALRQTHASVGLALMFSNLAIVVGFTALVTSNFVPTIHFGILVSIALLGGLAGNLFLLPLLLRIRAMNPLAD